MTSNGEWPARSSDHSAVGWYVAAIVAVVFGLGVVAVNLGELPGPVLGGALAVLALAMVVTTEALQPRPATLRVHDGELHWVCGGRIRVVQLASARLSACGWGVPGAERGAVLIVDDGTQRLRIAVRDRSVGNLRGHCARHDVSVDGAVYDQLRPHLPDEVGLASGAPDVAAPTIVTLQPNANRPTRIFVHVIVSWLVPLAVVLAVFGTASLVGLERLPPAATPWIIAASLVAVGLPQLAFFTYGRRHRVVMTITEQRVEFRTRRGVVHYDRRQLFVDPGRAPLTRAYDETTVPGLVIHRPGQPALRVATFDSGLHFEQACPSMAEPRHVVSPVDFERLAAALGIGTRRGGGSRG